tara:strand:- start:13103 stop:17062 length:3960 start_codon:yes stop_codon:yes gene_type:complete
MKYSKNGYKRNSKDRNNPYNVIPSGNITMEGVDFPVMGTDNLGNQKLMMPGANYTFPGNTVFEVPLQNFPIHFQEGLKPKSREGSTYLRDKRSVIEDPLNVTNNLSNVPLYEGQDPSTHYMADDDNLTAWPTLFQDPSGNWYRGGREEAERLGEIYTFNTREEMIAFAREGNWKPKMQNGGDLPLAQNGKESKKEKKARLEQERLQQIENQKRLNQQISEDFSTDPVEINTEGLRNPLRVYPNPITSDFMMNNPIPTQDTDINYVESMVDYYAGLNDPNSLISQRISGDFSNDTRFGEYSATLPVQKGQSNYDIHNYDFEDGKMIKTIDPKRQSAFENLQVTPKTVFNAVYPRLTNFTFLDATDKEKIGIESMKKVDEKREQWIKDGNNPEDFDMFAGLNIYEARALLSKAEDVVGPHAKSLINPYYDELVQGENYEKNKRKLLIKAGEDPNDPRFENLMGALVMPEDITNWLETSNNPDVTKKQLLQDWKDTLAHELGHITGRDDFMSERDNEIYKQLNYAHIHTNEMNEGMKEAQSTFDGHLAKRTTHEASADLNAVRLDMLERGIYDYRNEQMTKEHWDEYLKSYDPDMKTTNENYPLSLQRILYRYRIDLEENPHRSRLIVDPKNTGDDQDSNIRFINNSVADANEIGDDIDNTVMAKYGTELPKALYGGSLPKAQTGYDLLQNHQIAAELREKGIDPNVKASDLNSFSGIGYTDVGKNLVSHGLDILSIPSNLVAETLESLGGYGDKEFNFSDAIPGFSGDYSFTNMHGDPTKSVSNTIGMEDSHWAKKLVVDLLTDPTSYIGAGIFKNLIKKSLSKSAKIGARSAPKIINKSNINISKYNISTADVLNLGKDIEKRLLTDKFIKNNMKATGRSREEVINSIQGFSKQFDNANVIFDDLGEHMGAVWNGTDVVVNSNKINKSSRANILGNIEHEIEHLFSDVGNTFKKSHPTLKASDDIGMGNFKVSYYNLPFEQQVRFRKAIKWLEQNAGLKMGDDITDAHIDKLSHALKNWSKESGKDFAGVGGKSDVQALLSSLDYKNMLSANEFAMINKAPVTSSHWKKSVKDILNATYGTIPIGFGSTMLPEKKYGGSLLKAEGGDEVTINFDELEKGIRYAESLNGELMKNPKSSASGLYQQLFDEIEYEGTRDEFIEDIDYQKELFKKRAYGEMEDVPGLISNGIDLYSEYENQLDLTKYGLNPLTIAGLSNMLGRQGTRKYIGNVLRDGKTIEEIFPHLYGEDAKYPNHTPEEYITKFNKGLITKQEGGSTLRKIKRIKQQLNKYKEGKEISYIAKKELINLGLIDNALTSNKSVR